jgi:hypothetical protein
MLRIMTFLISIALVSPVFAESLTMNVTNKTANKIMIKLYSQDRKGHVWPSASSHYPVSAGRSESFKISCFRNEKICYGAKQDGANRTWGSGFTGKSGCSSCCYRCNDTSYSTNLTY